MYKTRYIIKNIEANDFYNINIYYMIYSIRQPLIKLATHLELELGTFSSI